jgi:hypothetical protein
MAMDEQPEELRPATREELAETIQFAMMHRDGKRIVEVKADAAKAMCDRVIELLRLSRFVIMKRPRPLPKKY